VFQKKSADGQYPDLRKTVFFGTDEEKQRSDEKTTGYNQF